MHFVAQHILTTYGNDMSRVVVVFPNKRASLFLNRELVELSRQRDGVPMWAPQYTTINDLFLEFAQDVTIVDPTVAVCRLFEVYRQVMAGTETIDRFYGWGEVILADFNDIDKQLVDADKLFKFTEDWNKLTADDFLSEGQLEALRHYFGQLRGDELAVAKKRFVALWKAMPSLYHGFKDCLLRDRVLYDGALLRYVVEQKLYERVDADKTYLFVGFNILAPVHKALMRGMKECGNVRFYWDYDSAMKPTAWGLDGLYYDTCSYIRENLSVMPNELPEGWQETMSVPEISFLKTDTSNAQAHYVPRWLKTAEMSARSAVVLADEGMLPQVLATLPDGPVNITMGYPMSDTPVLSFVTALADLQIKGRKPNGQGFYRTYRRPMEEHPFVKLSQSTVWDYAIDLNPDNLLRYIDDNVKAVLAVIPQMEQLEEIASHVLMYEEALYRVHVAIGRLQELDLHLEDCKLAYRLLLRVCRSTNVPFHGEPLIGLQVMGVLETRALDFENLLILSANDGTLPKTQSTHSLIPYCLREPFGLSTEKEQVNVYAYNFFRLLRRAKRVSLVFPTSGNKMGQCEMSRFMRQLLAETDLEIVDSRLAFSFDTESDSPEMNRTKFPKDAEDVAAIYSSGDGKVVTRRDGTTSQRVMSPSAVNTYINCPLSYYYKYIEKIRVDQDVSTALDANQFGNVFHHAANLFYSKLTENTQGEVTPEMLDAVTNDVVEAAVDRAFAEKIFDVPGNDVDGFMGELVIVRDVMLGFMNRLITMDKQLGRFRILQCEQRHTTNVKVNVDGEEMPFFMGGDIDRLDYVYSHPLSGRPTIRVVDYKTGGKPEDKVLASGAMADLFLLDVKQAKKNILQTFLYAKTLQGELKNNSNSNLRLTEAEREADIMPALLYMQHSSDAEHYDARVLLNDHPVNRFQDFSDEFVEALQRFLKDEMLNSECMFDATPVDDHCRCCDFRLLCGKPQI